MSTKPFSDLLQSVKETWTDDTRAVYEAATAMFQAELSEYGHRMDNEDAQALKRWMTDAAYAQMAEDMRSTRAARRARAVRVRRGNIDA